MAHADVEVHAADGEIAFARRTPRAPSRSRPFSRRPFAFFTADRPRARASPTEPPRRRCSAPSRRARRGGSNRARAPRRSVASRERNDQPRAAVCGVDGTCLGRRERTWTGGSAGSAVGGGGSSATAVRRRHRRPLPRADARRTGLRGRRRVGGLVGAATSLRTSAPEPSRSGKRRRWAEPRIACARDRRAALLIELHEPTRGVVGFDAPRGLVREQHRECISGRSAGAKPMNRCSSARGALAGEAAVLPSTVMPWM